LWNNRRARTRTREQIKNVSCVGEKRVGTTSLRAAWGEGKKNFKGERGAQDESGIVNKSGGDGTENALHKQRKDSNGQFDPAKEVGKKEGAKFGSSTKSREPRFCKGGVETRGGDICSEELLLRENHTLDGKETGEELRVRLDRGKKILEEQGEGRKKAHS